jgi:tetratricopeptide (TPR) repeat protein
MALERSAGVEAQVLVETAMGLLPALAAGDVRRNLEGRLQVALADALMMTRGFASPEVMATLSRARGLLDKTAQPMESLRALCGLFNYHLMRSESPRCLELAKAVPKQGLDRPTAAVVRYLTGTAQLHLGNFKLANVQLESALSLYDEDGCRTVAFVPGYHLRSFTLIWLGLGTLYVGSLERAAPTMSAAVQDARSRDHPFTLVSALLALARFCNHTQDLQGARAAVDEGLAIATEQRSPYHVSRANILRAVGIIDSGRAEEGIALMEHALAEHRGTGANFQSSFNLTRLAEAYARAGRLGRALDLAAAAVAEVGRTGERWWEAEANRSHGEILLLAGPAHRAEAERCLEQALDCARRQGARLWELNAARSLAAMHLAEGRIDDARALLAPVCSAFADGVDHPGLRFARATLRQLA